MDSTTERELKRIVDRLRELSSGDNPLRWCPHTADAIRALCAALTQAGPVNAVQVATRACVVCGEQFPIDGLRSERQPRRDRIYCSDVCRTTAYRQRQRKSTEGLIPLARWNDHHDWPTVPSLRWLRFNAASNGLAKAFKKVGGRVLVDEDEFFRWAESSDERSK